MWPIDKVLFKHVLKCHWIPLLAVSPSSVGQYSVKIKFSQTELSITG